MLSRRAFVVGAAAGLMAAPAAIAQQRRVPRIAYLSANPAGDLASQAFLEGLRDFGYSEGQNLVIDYFLSPTIPDLPQWAAKAVADKPDVIVAINNAGALAAKAQTTTIPIVFAGLSSPVEVGLVASIARPGGNATGLSNITPDIAAKRLQMLSELAPGIARVAVLYQLENPSSLLALAEIRKRCCQATSASWDLAA